VGLETPLLVGGAVADAGPDHDHARPGELAPGGGHGTPQLGKIVAVGNRQHLPAVGFEATPHILGEGEVGGACQGDPVGVVEADQFSQPQVAGEGGCLSRHPLHHVPVPCQAVGKMVNHRVAGAVVAGRKVGLCQGHADGVAETLSQGAGGGLHPRGVPPLRVARGPAPPLAEAFQVVQGEVVAGEMEQGIEEHGAVAG